jgi:hypothetical protein
LLEGQVHIAVEALADIAKNGKSEAARVSVACAILDRTHGRTRAAAHAAPLHGTPDDPLQDFTLGSWPQGNLRIGNNTVFFGASYGGQNFSKPLRACYKRV